ncbi:MAG TPA: hypothetical protein VN892_05760 [Solirubrobacteraceae bacterium]|nr:hypothetical protein [Solirubrobacteraceae bacterium]
MREQYVAELRRDLDVAHARLGLAVGDPQAGRGGVVQTHVALQQVKCLGDSQAGVAERGAKRPPPDAPVVAAVGLAIRKHRHRPGAQSELKAQRILRLALSEPGSHFLGLRSGELGAFLRHWRPLQLADGIEQRNELVNLQKCPVGLRHADPQAL